MTKRLALIFAAASLAPAHAASQTPPPAPEGKAIVESCAAHKFETTVRTMVDGKVKSSKVKLCGKEGQTEAEWVATLKDAVKKVGTNPAMAPPMKEQITTALNLEIARIEAASASASAPRAGTASSLPNHLPVATVRPAERQPEYATLPPLPPPSTVASKPALAAAVPGPRKPRLTIRCSAPGEPGAGSPCDSLERDTQLIVRADEDLTGGTSLRFLRRGDARGEITLAQMRQGQSLRSKLPSQLCAGVASSKVQIQILAGSNQVVDTLGPYGLRC
jgi:hypothetical protein